MKRENTKKLIYILLFVIAAVLLIGFIVDKSEKSFSDWTNTIALYLTIVSIVLSLNNENG